MKEAEIKFKVITNMVLKELERTVNNHLQEGWELYGNTAYNDGEYRQSLTKVNGRLRNRILVRDNILELQSALTRALKEGSKLVSSNVAFDADGKCYVILKKTLHSYLDDL